MQFDLDAIAPAIGYKLLTATVTPRPIAWVTTLGPGGTVNAAPYSFFNVMGHAPPTLVVGLLRDNDRGFKDTAANILEGGEFVVNLVPGALAEAMNTTSIDAPRGVSELELAGLSTTPSSRVGPPRIAASPVAFECVLHASLLTGPQQAIAVGRILSIHIADDHVLDAERGHVDTPSLDLIARMHGSGWYARTRDTFQLTRPKWSGATAGAPSNVAPASADEDAPKRKDDAGAA
ncbi:MAG: flavin reductase family protein [Pseudomonadota bacterium]